jgi:hypothetical protein
VLADPAPQALLTAFADSGINLDLGFWIARSAGGNRRRPFGDQHGDLALVSRARHRDSLPATRGAADRQLRRRSGDTAGGSGRGRSSPAAVGRSGQGLEKKPRARLARAKVRRSDGRKGGSTRHSRKTRITVAQHRVQRCKADGIQRRLPRPLLASSGRRTRPARRGSDQRCLEQVHLAGAEHIPGDDADEKMPTPSLSGNGSDGTPAILTAVMPQLWHDARHLATMDRPNRPHRDARQRRGPGRRQKSAAASWQEIARSSEFEFAHLVFLHHCFQQGG